MNTIEKVLHNLTKKCNRNLWDNSNWLLNFSTQAPGFYYIRKTQRHLHNLPKPITFSIRTSRILAKQHMIQFQATILPSLAAGTGSTDHYII